MDLVTPTAGFGFDSVIKVLEVTAQEVVDRINRPDEEKLNGDTTLASEDLLLKKASADAEGVKGVGESEAELRNGPSDSKLFHAGKVTRVRSTHSTSDQGADTSGTESSAGSPSRISRIDSTTTIVLNQKVAEVLSELQKWMQEASEYGNMKGREMTLGKELVNNLYYLHSIESFLKDMDWPSQKVLTNKFSSQLVQWLKELFDFRNPSENESDYTEVLPHWEADEGLIAVTKWNLFSHFPNLIQKGYETFQQEGRYPMIYCTEEPVAENLIAKMSISRSWINLIDASKADWVSELEHKIITDSKENRTPTVLLLNTGRNVRNLEKACRVGAVYKVWVHLYGRNTFSYLVKRPETDQIAHSFTLELNKWMTSPPTMPYLTIYKKPVVATEDLNRLELSGLVSPTKEMLCFTPWFCSKVAGKEKTRALVEETCERGQFLLTMLKHYPNCVSIVPNWSTLTDGQVIVSALTFRYTPKPTKDINDANDSGSKHVEFEQPSAPYVDTLNSWLFHIMERDFISCLPIQFVYVKDSGWNILFDILSTEKFKAEDEVVIQRAFDTHMTVLECTVQKKIEFGKLVRATPELEWIDFETQWAGLGAVRYIPKFYRASDKPNEELSDGGASTRSAVAKAAKQHSLIERKSTINHVNAQIVEKLKSIDGAFSLGEDPDGDFCVQFGMVTNETEVRELVQLVISTGEEIEESSEFFNQMSELVKKGIEKATEELKRESDEALWEEGILRRVPVVGTFMNWWSPPVKESGVRGRALNLAQGKVESTENIYKYHMQVESVSPAASSANILDKMSSNANNVRK